MIEALADGRPDDLLGMAENGWVDFKQAPYQLNTDHGKFELCKDVTAFANASGGLLVIGVATSKPADRAVEVATGMHPFPQAQVNVSQHFDTVNDNLRPRVVVTHRWYRDPVRSASNDLYYLVLEVEPVAERDRWVIVRRILNNRGMFVDGVAVPQRHGDRTVYLPPEDIYYLINEGRRARELTPAVPQPPVADLAEEATVSLDELQHLQGWDDTPVLFWQSIPPRRTDLIPGLHSADGIRGGLDRQQVLRPSGFNFEDTLGRLRVYDGGLMIAKRERVLWVRPDGLVTAAASATEQLLGWAMEQRGVPQRLNTFVLTELTLEYFRVADALVAPRIPGAWRHRIVARRFRGDRPRLLGPGSTLYDQFLSDATQASADTWDRSWEAIGDPERDAFEALQRIYALFGVDVATNPDVQGDQVSAERFRDT